LKSTTEHRFIRATCWRKPAASSLFCSAVCPVELAAALALSAAAEADSFVD